jgi:hypothetical protein
MNLRIEFFNEETAQTIIVKNKGSQVLYHDSDIHEIDEYVELAVKSLELQPTGRELVNAFYELTGDEIDLNKRIKNYKTNINGQ